MKKIFVSTTLLLATLSVKAESLSDFFGAVEDEITGVFTVIKVIAFAIGAILLIVGAAILVPKILKGQDASKEVGLWFLAGAFFVLAGFLVDRLV